MEKSSMKQPDPSGGRDDEEPIQRLLVPGTIIPTTKQFEEQGQTVVSSIQEAQGILPFLCIHHGSKPATFAPPSWS
jgi:hypothetical protein